MTVETETNSTATEAENSAATETSTTETASTETAAETTTGDKLDLSKTGDETAETKTEETKESETDARYGAPAEDAEYDIKLPEGQTIDAEAMAVVAPELKALNLSNDSANKLVGVFAEKVLPHYQDQFTKNLEASIVTQRTEWEGAARDLVAGKAEDGSALVAKNAAGEKLSFDGKDIKGVSAVAARALDRLAPEGFRQFLEDTGLGVHPQMVAFAYQVGKAIAEDRDLETSTTTAAPPSRVDKYYPKKD